MNGLCHHPRPPFLKGLCAPTRMGWGKAVAVQVEGRPVPSVTGWLGRGQGATLQIGCAQAILVAGEGPVLLAWAGQCPFLANTVGRGPRTLESDRRLCLWSVVCAGVTCSPKADLPFS